MGAYQIHGHEIPGFVHAFGNVIALAQGETAADGGAGAGRDEGVEGVHVEGEMDRGVVTDMAEGEFHDAANAMSNQGRKKKGKIFVG